MGFGRGLLGLATAEGDGRQLGHHALEAALGLSPPAVPRGEHRRDAVGPEAVRDVSFGNSVRRFE